MAYNEYKAMALYNTNFAFFSISKSGYSLLYMALYRGESKTEFHAYFRNQNETIQKLFRCVWMCLDVFSLVVSLRSTFGMNNEGVD